jgi:putative component of toxin-antitoxin plasmid stabilization module
LAIGFPQEERRLAEIRVFIDVIQERVRRLQAGLTQDLEGVKEGLEALMQDFGESEEQPAINDLRIDDPVLLLIALGEVPPSMQNRPILSALEL